MSKAERERHRPSRATRIDEAIVARIAVYLKNTGKALEYRLRSLARAILGEDIDDHGRRRPSPRPVVRSHGPKLASFGSASTRIEHRDRRFVGEQPRIGERRFEQQLVQGLQPPRRSAHP